MIVTVPEKYELPVSSPAPITSERQHEHYLSEVLHKKHALNKTHIERLSKRFHLSPAVFF